MEKNSESDRDRQTRVQSIRLRLAMEEENMTTEALAEKLSIDSSSISKWLDEKNPITLNRHKHIAAALGRPADFLINRQPDFFSPATHKMSHVLQSHYEAMNNQQKKLWMTQAINILLDFSGDDTE